MRCYKDYILVHFYSIVFQLMGIKQDAFMFEMITDVQ